MKIVITNDSLMYNRGSEAVIRSITIICRFWLPDSKIIVCSGKAGEVLRDVYGADKIIPKFDSVGGISYFITEITDADFVIVTGADNYDYGFVNRHMIDINSAIFKNIGVNTHTILFDCSLRKDHVSREIIDDFKRFTYVTTRESETQKVLCEYLDPKKVKMYPDPAFILPAKKCNYPFGFNENNTIGINISNLIMGKRVGVPSDIIIPLYKNLIGYILKNTNYKVMLLQHVLNNGYDLEACLKLYEGYESNARVLLFQTESLNSMELKYIISKLKMLITARTHASIAAYSMNVPVIVVGYSIKSLGIAKDIFGTSDKFVLDIKHIKFPNDLVDNFKYFENNYEIIKNKLVNYMPFYKKKALDFGELLKI